MLDDVAWTVYPHSSPAFLFVCAGKRTSTDPSGPGGTELRVRPTEGGAFAFYRLLQPVLPETLKTHRVVASLEPVDGQASWFALTVAEAEDVGLFLSVAVAVVWLWVYRGSPEEVTLQS